MSRGFTLVELLVSIAIIGILSSILFSGFSGSQAQARDQERQTELKEMQLALERFFNQNGHYPEPACADPGNPEEVDSTDCDTYIVDLVPDYIDSLPGATSDYQYKYKVNNDTRPTEYKFAAEGVEVLEVDSFAHPFAYCPRFVAATHICDDPNEPPANLYAVYSRNGWDL